MTAHQRLIRDSKAALDLREPPRSLKGYRVALVHRDEAMPIIMAYEWLGNPGSATMFVGLLSPPRDTLEGVVGFGQGPASGSPRRSDGKYGDIRDRLGGQALCLERGACVHYAPANAASFLINRACKLIALTTGVERFFAYADPSAGEYGGVYQAAGWAYLGQGIQGKGADRPHRYFVLPPGLDASDPANWKTTRALRRPGHRMSIPEACALGWGLALRPAKHVYATHVGPDRQRWRSELAVRPYPAPEPELKLKWQEAPSREPPSLGLQYVARDPYRDARQAAAPYAGRARDAARGDRHPARGDR